MTAGPQALRARYVLHVVGPRYRGWIELSAPTLYSARAECTGLFPGAELTLYEREPHEPGYTRVAKLR